MSNATLPNATATAAPDFALPDHLGGRFVLRQALEARRGPLVIVFYRGHWCPYCRRYLTKLQSHWPRFQSLGAATLAVISPEPPATSRALAVELELSLPILADTNGEVIGRYGTRNGFTAARALLPHASVFILDRTGAVRFRSIDRNYKKRTTMRTILTCVGELVGKT